ncbi:MULTISPECIES: hypothetical protein [Sphingomonas]|uniref:hypothetical protein n=1 Tax=Sphingomonas TaxID=13687 RepID=UPI00193C5C4B|nr:MULTISPECIES: hypothetical protein [Sphingomonas]
MRPRHDKPTGKPVELRLSAARLRLASEIARRRRGGPDGRGLPGADPCPVTPDRPLDLSGGAAAALAFDD